MKTTPNTTQAEHLSAPSRVQRIVPRLAGLAIGGQVLFTLSWLVGGLIEPDYDPLAQTASELASLDGHHPWVMMAGFLAFGASLVGLALALRRTVGGGIRRPIARPAMLLVAAAAMPVVAAARMDCARSTQACRDAIEANAVSGADQLHDLASLLVFVMLIFAPVVLLRAFDRDPGWLSWRRPSAITTVGTFILMATFVLAADGTPVGGLVQRFLIVWLSGWVVLTARRAAERPRLGAGSTS